MKKKNIGFQNHCVERRKTNCLNNETAKSNYNIFNSFWQKGKLKILYPF